METNNYLKIRRGTNVEFIFFNDKNSEDSERALKTAGELALAFSTPEVMAQISIFRQAGFCKGTIEIGDVDPRFIVKGFQDVASI